MQVEEFTEVLCLNIEQSILMVYIIVIANKGQTLSC